MSDENRVLIMMLSLLLLCTLSDLALAQEPIQESKTPHESSVKSFHESIAPALRWTQEGSWQPPKGEISLGLNELRWSPWERVSVHAWTPLLPIGGLNLGARASLYSTERWTIGAELRALLVDFSRFMEDAESKGAEAPRLLVSPFSLYGSYLITPRLVAGLSFHHTAISVTAGAQGDAELKGVAVSTNRHARLHLGWALSESWSLWWVANRMLYQGVGGAAVSTVKFKDGGSITIYGSAEKGLVEPGQSAHRFLLSYRGDLFSWSMGFATGVPPIYIIGTVVPQLSFLPYFDLSFRF